MPGFPKISDEKSGKEIVLSPDIIIAQAPAPSPAVNKRNRIKRHIIVAVATVSVVALILAAILIGMYFFTEAQKELVKYTLDFDRNAKQDVTSDPNTNVVTYEIQNGDQKAWVVNDFNKDIQVVKIQTATDTNCYLSALNRTRARDPSQITGPETKEVNKAATLTYVTSGSPISDTSFLARQAREYCNGVSTYWLYPKCSDNTPNLPPNAAPPTSYSTAAPSVKPSTSFPIDSSTLNPNDNSPWYFYWSYPYNANTTVYCVTGCCKTVCACNMRYYWYVSSGSLYCIWVASACPQLGVYDNPVSQACTDGPTGLTCPNYSPATLPDC